MARIYFSYVKEFLPIQNVGDQNFYRPFDQLATQTLPSDITRGDFSPFDFGYVEYSTTPKREVMELVRRLSRYQTTILGKSEVEALMAQHYTPKSGGYVVQEADDTTMQAEIIHVVDTFDWVTVTIPLVAYDTFEGMITKVSNMFSGVKKDVEGSNIVVSKIESDQPLISSFMNEEVSPGVTLYQAILANGGQVDGRTP